MDGKQPTEGNELGQKVQDALRRDDCNDGWANKGRGLSRLAEMNQNEDEAEMEWTLSP